MMNIASIMATVLPGTFVPDMSAAEKPAMSAIPNLPGAVGDLSAATGGVHPNADSSVHGVTSFKDTVKAMLDDVNDKITTSDQNTRDLASGKTNDVNKVVTSVEEANLSLQYAMAIRTKLLDAYTEINHMTV